MNRTRLIFILSLLILAGVFVSIIYFLPSREIYTESKRAHIISGDDEWILEYNIVNNETRDIEYTILVTVDGTVYRDSTVVKSGKTYTYIHHIYPQQLEEGKVEFAVFEDGKTEPVEQATYHIDFK